MALEIQMEIWRRVEVRDGATFKTEFVEKRWVPMGSNDHRIGHGIDGDPDLFMVPGAGTTRTAVRR